MRHLRQILAPCTGLALLAATASAQNPDMVLRRNTPIIGNGNIVLFDQMVVNNNGFNYAVVKTDDPVADEVVLLNGFMVLAKGTGVAAPTGAFMNSVVPGSMSTNNSGYIAWGLDLGGGLQNSEDRGLYWNTLLLGQEGSPPFTDNIGGVPFTTSANSGGEFPDTVYSTFSNTFLNDHDEMLVLGNLQDEAFKGQENYAAIVTTNGVGQITDEEFLVVKRYPFPATGDEVKALTTSRVNWDFNNRRDWIGQVELRSVGVFLMMNGQPLFKSGDPIPSHPGQNLISFTSSSLNNHGDFVMKISTNAANPVNEAIVLNGDTVVINEGQTFPAIAPHTVTRFDGAPVEIADSLDVFWYCQTSNTVNAQDRCYFRSVYKGNNTWDHKIIAQEGVTVAAGSPIGDLRSTESAFAISDNGRFWVGEVLLANNAEALLVADFGASVPLHGCSGVNEGTLQKVNGDPLIGKTLTYEVDGDMLAGTAPILLWSTKPAIPGSDCGIRAGKKEILINATSPQMFAKMVGTPYAGDPVQFTFQLPLDPALIDATIYAQASITIQNGRLRLTNAIEMSIGQPN